MLLDENVWQLDPAALRFFQRYIAGRRWWSRLRLPRFVSEHFAELTTRPLRWTDDDFEAHLMSGAYGGLSGGVAAHEKVRRLMVALNNEVPIELRARGQSMTIATHAQLIEHVLRPIAGELEPDDSGSFDQGLYRLLERETKIT